MTVTANNTGAAFSLPPEPGTTAEEIVERARAIAYSLIDRQAETEERTCYAPDTHEAFAAAGLYRILVPKRYGGLELGLDTFFKVVVALTRGCPSTGWMYCLGAAHAHAVGTLFEERTQAEVFAGGEFIAPATVAPTGTAVPAPDGGWTVTGTWNYCSGAPYSTHLVAHALVTPEDGGEPYPVMFVVPRADYEVLDDWGHHLGLKGSGSNSVRVAGAHVPAHRVLPMHLSQATVTGGTPGLALHGNSLYGGGPLSVMVLEDAALALGMGQAALDAYEELMRSRQTLFPPILPRTADPDFQYWYGEAAGLLQAAESALNGAIGQWQQYAERGPAYFTPARELRIVLACREVIRMCWRAVESYLYPTAGSSAVKHGERMERIWRDLSMQHSHAGIAVFLNSHANREFSKAHFGIGS
ncbi:acyl-CoA dehydrogenase family protein [Streptomyces sp. NPDC097619]|uniref:acyl-CoA dehydrogenase family protein n=1 Tax=Streptomyces sp. NPDC097619 TaxID=3157228 RepID=UPI00332027E2